MKRKNLENALVELVRELKPAPFPPENAAEQWSVALDGAEETNSRWQTYMSAALKTARAFEIHCWAEETECICKIASVITAVLAVIAIIGAVTVTGSGFLDLSNIARYFLIGFAVVFGIAAVMTGRYGWRSR